MYHSTSKKQRNHVILRFKRFDASHIFEVIRQEGNFGYTHPLVSQGNYTSIDKSTTCLKNHIRSGISGRLTARREKSEVKTNRDQGAKIQNTRTG